MYRIAASGAANADILAVHERVEVTSAYSTLRQVCWRPCDSPTIRTTPNTTTEGKHLDLVWECGQRDRLTLLTTCSSTPFSRRGQLRQFRSFPDPPGCTEASPFLKGGLIIPGSGGISNRYHCLGVRRFVPTYNTTQPASGSSVHCATSLLSVTTARSTRTVGQHCEGHAVSDHQLMNLDA